MAKYEITQRQSNLLWQLKRPDYRVNSMLSNNGLDRAIANEFYKNMTPKQKYSKEFQNAVLRYLGDDDSVQFVTVD